MEESGNVNRIRTLLGGDDERVLDGKHMFDVVMKDDASFSQAVERTFDLSFLCSKGRLRIGKDDAGDLEFGNLYLLFIRSPLTHWRLTC